MDWKGIVAFTMTALAFHINIISLATEYWVENEVITILFSQRKGFMKRMEDRLMIYLQAHVLFTENIS